MSYSKTQPPTGPGLVERVIAASHGRQHDGDIRGAWRDAVLDMLDAIREPSEAMLRAVPQGLGHRYYARMIWRAMINALRQEIAG